MNRIEDMQHTLLDGLQHMESSFNSTQQTFVQTRRFHPSHSSCRVYQVPAAPTCFSQNTICHDSPHITSHPPTPTISSAPTPDVPMPDAASPGSCVDTLNFKALALSNVYHNVPLPSSEIKEDELVSVDSIVQAKTDKDKPSTIAQKLAKDAIFGRTVMCKCTPSGTKDMPALPKAEMQQLKDIVFQAFPRFWHSPDTYEKEWKKRCWPAIEQACGRLRRRNK